MRMRKQSRFCSRFPDATTFFTVALATVFLILSASQPVSALAAFAPKYGLRCSACHESWPMLNYFGQKFKDNGYQLMNERDAPIWRNTGYWPLPFRMTPTNSAGSATPAPPNLGNITTYPVGFRYTRFLTSRAGFAWHNESQRLHQPRTGPSIGLNTENVSTSELLMGFESDF
jgi:hypothetical protein